MPNFEDPIDEIRLNLQGPVMRVMRNLVPELAAVHHNQAYDLALDDLRILKQCFQAFHDHHDQFLPFLIDTAKRPIGDDHDMPLYCGRSLNQVAGIVVRSAARRYFRRRLPTMVSNVRRSAALERRGMMMELMESFKGSQPTSAPPKQIPEGEALYREIADYLHFDWQVPLVPAYSKLNVTQIRRLGSSIMELRDEQSLKAAVAGKPLIDQAQDVVKVVEAPANDSVPRVEEARPVFDPSMLSEPELILARLIDHEGVVRISILADALGRPHARAALAANPIRRNAIIPPDVGAGAIAILVKLMDLRDEQIAVLLVTAYAMLGRDIFPTVFGSSANPATLRQLVERSRAAGITRYTEPKVLADFIESMFAKARAKILKVA